MDKKPILAENIVVSIHFFFSFISSLEDIEDDLMNELADAYRK